MSGTYVNITNRKNIKIDRYGNYVDTFGPNQRIVQELPQEEDALGKEAKEGQGVSGEEKKA